MSREPKPQVVTANDLLSGAVVFWTGQTWSNEAAAAQAFADPAAQKAALAKAEADVGRVVAPYLAAVDEVGLVRLRERIRVEGPTIAYANRPAAHGV